MKFGLLLLCCKVIWASRPHEAHIDAFVHEGHHFHTLDYFQKVQKPDSSKPYVQSPKVELPTLILWTDYKDHPFGGADCTADRIEEWGWADKPTNYRESIRGLYTRLSRGRFELVPLPWPDPKVKYFRFSNYSTDSKTRNIPGKCFSWNTELDGLLKREFGDDWRQKIQQLIIGMSIGGCGAAGIGGGGRNTNWGGRCNWGAAPHEMGHSLGFDHAGNDDDNNGKIDSAYGDQTSFMGHGNHQFGLSAPELYFQAWLNTDAVVYARDVPTTGTSSITLNYLDNAATRNTGVQVLIYHANPEPGKNTRLYFLSFRKATLGLENNQQIQSLCTGVAVHWARYKGTFTAPARTRTMVDGELYYLGPTMRRVIHQHSHTKDQVKFSVGDQFACLDGNVDVCRDVSYRFSSSDRRYIIPVNPHPYPANVGLSAMVSKNCVKPWSAKECTILQIQELKADGKTWITKATSTWSTKFLAHTVSYIPKSKTHLQIVMSRPNTTASEGDTDAVFRKYTPGPQFQTGEWSSCDAVCGIGKNTRTVECVNLALQDKIIDLSVCKRYEVLPVSSRACQSRDCTEECKNINCGEHGGCFQYGVCTCFHGYSGDQCQNPPPANSLRPLYRWEFDEPDDKRDYKLASGATISGGVLNANKRGAAATLPDLMFGGTPMSFEYRIQTKSTPYFASVFSFMNRAKEQWLVASFTSWGNSNNQLGLLSGPDGIERFDTYSIEYWDPLSTWIHGVITVDATGKVQYWRNGELRPRHTDKAAIVPSARRNYCTIGDKWDGLIDFVRVYDSVLSPEVIKQLASKGFDKTQVTYTWATGEFEDCMTKCGQPKETLVRKVFCLGSDGGTYTDAECIGLTKPTNTMVCRSTSICTDGLTTPKIDVQKVVASVSNILASRLIDSDTTSDWETPKDKAIGETITFEFATSEVFQDLSVYIQSADRKSNPAKFEITLFGANGKSIAPAEHMKVTQVSGWQTFPLPLGQTQKIVLKILENYGDTKTEIYEVKFTKRVVTGPCATKDCKQVCREDTKSNSAATCSCTIGVLLSDQKSCSVDDLADRYNVGSPTPDPDSSGVSYATSLSVFSIFLSAAIFL